MRTRSDGYSFTESARLVEAHMPVLTEYHLHRGGYEITVVSDVGSHITRQRMIVRYLVVFCLVLFQMRRALIFYWRFTNVQEG